MVNLIHEDNLLYKIDNLAANTKIQNSVGLNPQNARLEIRKHILTTRQHLNAAKFYLDLIEHMECVPYLSPESSLSTERNPFIDFLGDNLEVQIRLVHKAPFPLVIFVVLSGFFSSLVSSDDCIVKIINIIYNLVPYKNRYYSSDIRQELQTKAQNRRLIRHLRNFHAIGRKEVRDKKGSLFNIAKEIRNQLTHDYIGDVVIFPSQYNLAGSPIGLDLNLYLHNSFFPANINHSDTEITAFCRSVFDETVTFIDECYMLIFNKLRHSGRLPV